jgi:hypothetical protein
MLKMAEPTIVPAPMSELSPIRMTAISEVKNSGAELPIAIKVAPATSGLSFSLSEMMSREGTK